MLEAKRLPSRIDTPARVLAEANLLNALALAAANEDDPARLLDTALRLLAEVVPFSGGVGALLEDGALVIRAAAGPFASEVLGQRRQRPEGLLWQVVESGKPFLSGDVVAEAPDLVTPPGSQMAVPLSRRGAVFGVVAVHATEPNAFEVAGVALLRRVAAILAAPIQLALREGAEARAHAEAEAARHRLAFLAEASALLAGSLDYETTLAQATRLAVPALADWCVCDVADDGGRLRRIAVAGADPRQVQLERRLRQLTPDGGQASVAAEVLATGESRLLADVAPGALAGATVDDERLRLARQLGVRSAMLVPLIARGRALGVLSFFSTSTSTQEGRRYGPADLALAEELAHRAGLAADSALLYREAQAALAARDRALLYAEAERDRLKQVVEVLPEAVLIVGPDRRFAVTNVAAREILDMDLEGRSLPTAAEPSPIVRNIDGSPRAVRDLALQRAVLHGEAVRGEQYLIRARADGPDVPVLANSVPLHNVDGEPAGGLVVFQDISAIKDFERARDEFLASITHDLHTPLTAMRGFVQLLKRRAEREGSAHLAWIEDGLQGIATATAKMERLVAEFLDVGRLQMGRPLDLDRRPVDLVGLARAEAGILQRSAPRHRIIVEAAVPELVGRWDAHRLERVLTNLLANAVKYSPDGDAVTVRIAVEQTESGACAVLSVRDEGVGIPAADLPHIFARFYRAKNVVGRFDGMGIGLASIKQIVEQHGGTVAVASREAAGTCVTVRLPLDGDGMLLTEDERSSSEGINRKR